MRLRPRAAAGEALHRRPANGARVVGPVRRVVAPDDARLSREAIERWLRRGAEAVSGYFGRFPLPRVLVIVSPGSREGVSGGTTWGYAGASIVISVDGLAERKRLRLTRKGPMKTLAHTPCRQD